ncbi:ABC transporter transmembrane domain-containing protein [Oceanospirillum sediminis]|uniref:ATP-binding cassette domain-containing protein n=1 Tax=Oceanospirillum sediminis TaxID=2760088 RepID=A0A839IMT8_9GAMM|nr:ABC transporter transmembrane domain-containing protein [Oceanospirillum sediminis]MBB1486014.1 ATP-binding cassette domain-containing protein [Oceanospirillum sediminis]
MITWLWPFIRPYKARLILAVIALISTAGLTLALGQGVRLLFDEGFVAQSPEGLANALTIFLILVVLVSIGAYFRFYMVSWLGERVVADIRQKLYQHLISLDPGFYEDNLSGEIQSRLTTDTALLQTVIGSSLSFALRNTLTFTGGIILMFLSNFKLSLIVLLAVPAIVFPVIWFGRKVRRLSRQSQDKIADTGAWAGESLQHIRIVQAFTREDMACQEFSRSAEDAFDTALKRIRHRATLIALVMLLVMGSVAGMIWIGGNDVITGELSGGDLAAFVFYAIMVAGSLAAVTEVYGEVQRAAGAAERIQELMAAQSSIRSPDESQASGQDISQHSSSDKTEINYDSLISFRDISFTYPTRPDSPAIKHLTLDIHPGERIALVGPSGAGKSTLFDLLLRFRDPQQGQISIHNQPLPEWNLQQLRNMFALVPQQPALFTGSIMDNLRYGAPDATEEEIIQAARAAHADEFIRQLPDQYHSFLGEQGIRLSGGQKQRLAIARAILRDPQILLLDEATSALDAQSERLVQQALDELMENRTTLIIAHRLATVIHADRIAVFDQGELKAVGHHQQLLEASPLYKKLARLQFQGASAELDDYHS